MDVQQNRNAVKKLVGYLADLPGLYQDMRLPRVPPVLRRRIPSD
jgi:hypothetical protein